MYLQYPTIPYNTLQYLHYPTVVTNTVIQLVTQTPKAVASRAKRSEIVDLQLINQIPDLQYLTNTLQNLQYLNYPTVVTNTVIRLVTQRPKAVASRAKRSEIVDLQLTNQIADLHYPTLPYNTLFTIPSIPTLPCSCNKYCDPIDHSGAQGCSIDIPSKAK